MKLVDVDKLFSNVPEPMKVNIGDSDIMRFNEGWNACNDAWTDLLVKEANKSFEYDISELIDKLDDLRLHLKSEHDEGDYDIYFVYATTVSQAIITIKEMYGKLQDRE